MGYENKEKQKEIAEYQKKYGKEYRKRNRDKIREYLLKNRERDKKRKREWWLKDLMEKPWKTSFRDARARCMESKHQAYRYYGAKGIQFKMTMQDFEHLWFRDNAFMMDRPSIDRRDSTEHYELNNCRFLELSTNSRRTV